MAARLAAAPNAKARAELVRDLAAEEGVSLRTAWRRAREGGWRSHRKDAKNAKSSASPNSNPELSGPELSSSRPLRLGGEILLAAKIMHNSAKGKNERMLRPGWLVAQDLRKNSPQITPMTQINPEFPGSEKSVKSAESADALNRALHAAHLSKAEMEEARDRPRYTRMRSLHPNHVHQVDASCCVSLFQSPRGILYRDLRKRVYQNRPEAVLAVYGAATKIWRYLVVDHYSSAFHVLYRDEPGENSLGYVECCLAAWRRKDDLPFHGVPEIVLGDQGSGILAEKAPTRRWLETLGIRCLTHLPGNPRAKGAVEAMHRVWEEAFESGLASDPCRDVEELNARAREFMAFYHAERELARAKATRTQVWSSIPQAKLVELPEDEDLLRDLLHYQPEPREIGRDGYLQFARRGTSGLWYVEDSSAWGRTGIVTLNPWRLTRDRTLDVLVDVDGGQRRIAAREARVDPISGFALDAPVFGESFRRPADGPTETAMKAALGTELPEGFRSFRGMDTMDDLDGMDKTAAAQMPRVGRELAMPEQQPRKISAIRAMLHCQAWARREYGEVTSAEIAALRALWPDEGAQLDEAELERGIAALTELHTAGGAVAAAG
jgi:transposase InsO family protein